MIWKKTVVQTLLVGLGGMWLVACAASPAISATPSPEIPPAEVIITPESTQTVETLPEELSVTTTAPVAEIESPAATPVMEVPTAMPAMETSEAPPPLPEAPPDSLEAALGAGGYALRFFGTGSDDIDRVKIPLDDPATVAPGPPADIGATDFSFEWWMRASLAENPASPVSCGPGNVNWIYGNIIFDRDRYNQDRKFGISLAGGQLVVGISGEGSGDATLCGVSTVADEKWHHIALQRRRSDGYLWLFVDGRLEAEGPGPGGDISYPDDGQPGDFCNGPCVNSDPFLVIAAEKHDAGPEYPSFSGWIDEVRLSNILRYDGNFTRPTAPFQPDEQTAALWHFDEGSGEVTFDAAPAGLSPGYLRVGGPHQGPQWVISDAPLGN